MHEKKGGSQVSVCKCKVFRDKMEERNLSDLGAKGPQFTWRGSIFHGGQWIYERLDRALSNEDWKLMFMECQVRVLTIVDFSDYHPIMLSLASSNYEKRPKQFWFESAWLVENDYLDRIKGYWNNKEELIKNLHRIETNAIDWKNYSIQHVQRTERGIMARLQGIQRHIQHRQYNKGLVFLERKLQGALRLF